MKTDTPRTDSHTWYNLKPTELVAADFARQLERENAELRAMLAKLVMLHKELFSIPNPLAGIENAKHTDKTYMEAGILLNRI